MKNLKNSISEKDKNIMINLGKWLLKQRKISYHEIDGKKKPITQSILGKKLGVTFQQIQKYEKGSNFLPLYRWVECLKFFNVSPKICLEEILSDRFLESSDEEPTITENKTGDNNDNNDVCPKE